MAFAITTKKIKQVLIDSPIDIISVVEQLQATTAVKDKNIPLFDEDVFENVTTVEKLWQKLSKFWSIYNYEILKILLKIVQCKKANEIFDEFLSRIDISALEDQDLVLHCEPLETQGSIKPYLRIKVRAEKCTYSIRRKIEEVVSSKYNLEKYTLRFRAIKRGCFEFVYEISNALMSYLLACDFTKTDAVNFIAHDIIDLQINDIKLGTPYMVCTIYTSCAYLIFQLRLSDVIEVLNKYSYFLFHTCTRLTFSGDIIL